MLSHTSIHPRQIFKRKMRERRQGQFKLNIPEMQDLVQEEPEQAGGIVLTERAK